MAIFEQVTREDCRGAEGKHRSPAMVSCTGASPCGAASRPAAARKASTTGSEGR